MGPKLLITLLMVGGAMLIFRFLGKRAKQALEAERDGSKAKGEKKMPEEVGTELTECSVCGAFAATRCERENCPFPKAKT